MSSDPQHLPSPPSLGTLAIHAGQDPEQFPSWSVVPPINMSTTFKQSAPGVHKGHDYSRAGNPTRDVLEAQFAAIGSGKHALTWASGLAATTAVLQLLRPGDHVIAMNDLYGGTNRLFRRVGMPAGLLFDFVDATNPKNVEAALKPNTKLVWVETPTNPMLQVCDIRGIANVLTNKRSSAIYVVDNTFMSAYFQRPLELGADIEFSSVTKYYNGHSDTVMGVTIMRDDDLATRLRFLQLAVGAVPSPFDCYLVNRGLKTLHIRMEAHQRNAYSCAYYLRASEKVKSVTFPGFPDHPGHAIAKQQSSGFSGMISFRINGDLQAAKTFLSSCKIFTLAESLGAVESLCEHPAIMTHASIVKEERERLGITDNLIRLSCGIETTVDLLRDLEQALEKAVPGRSKVDVNQYVNILDQIKAGSSSSAPAAAAAAPAEAVDQPASRGVSFSEQGAVSSPAASANPNARGRVVPGTMPHPANRFEVLPSQQQQQQQQQQQVVSPQKENPHARGRVPGGTMPHPASRFELHTPTRAQAPPGGNSTVTLG